MSRRRRRAARWPLVVIALVFLGVGAAALLADDDEPADEANVDPTVIVTTTVVPTESVEGDPDPVVRSFEPYALTYRVEGFTKDGGAVIDLEHRWVEPPFASRVETVPEGDEDGDPTFVQIADFGVLQTGREGETRAVLVTEPTIAPGDARVAVDALEWRHERRTILDRSCQVFRSGGPMDVATVDAPTDTSWADLCVAADGTVLQEDWVIGGEVFRRRTAVELDDTPTFDDDRFAVTGERAEGAESGLLVELTRESRPADVAHHELVEPPAGFRHRGRFGYSPPRAQADVGAPESPKIAIVLDLYTDGDGGIVVVANGGSSDRSPSVQVGEGDTTVDLGALGTGELVPGLRQSEVRVGLAQGRFLRVYGTLPVADLATLTRSLRANTDPDGTVTAKP